MARVVGRIPGRLEELRYIRTGRYSGPYKHPFGPGAITEAMSDGSLRLRRPDGTPLWLQRKDGIWAANPRRGANPWLALYNASHKQTGRGGHAMHRHYHHYHNPEVLTGIVRHPVGVATDAAAGLAGIYFPIAIGNWAMTFLPAGVPGAGIGITDKLVRLGVRGGAAWAIHRFGTGFLPHEARKVLGLGMVIGVAGSFVLELLGTNIIVGQGDTAQTPLGIFRGIGLAGYADLGARAGRMRLAGDVDMGGYVDSRLGARANLARHAPLNVWRPGMAGRAF